MSQYESGPETGWSAAHNVSINYASELLSDNREINSLRLINGSSLDLNGHTLTLNSGGLMLGGGINSISGTLGSEIATTPGRPLYIHNPMGGLTLSGNVALTGGMDVVKTKVNPLVLASNATHSIGSLYIHQGKVHLQDGWLSTDATSGEIFIGDGAE